MSCHKVTFNGGSGIICLANIFEFEGFTFEWHAFCGPTPVNKRTLDPRKTIPHGFWRMISRWVKLTKAEQEKFRIYG